MNQASPISVLQSSYRACDPREFFVGHLAPTLAPAHRYDRMIRIAHRLRKDIPFRAKAADDFFTHRQSRLKMDAFAADLEERGSLQLEHGTAWKHWVGLLHAHTAASDGEGTAEEAFEMARDDANLDFFAVTDHAEMFIGDSGAAKWSAVRSAADRVLTSRFVSFAGFEYSHLWRGHFVVLGTADYRSSLEDSSLRPFTEWLVARRAEQPVVIFAHPGYHYYRRATEFEHFQASDLKDALPFLVGLEVIHRNDFTAHLMGYTNRFSYVDEALASGWQVAGMGSQDTHRLTWGIQDSVRTIALAQDLRRDSILDALRARRFYSTNNESLRVSFELQKRDGDWAAMGTALNDDDLPASTNVSFRWVDLKGHSPPARMELISNGNVLAAREFALIPPVTDSALLHGSTDDEQKELVKKFSQWNHSPTAWQPVAGEFTATIALARNEGRPTSIYMRFFQGYDREIFTETAPIFIRPR